LTARKRSRGPEEEEQPPPKRLAGNGVGAGPSALPAPELAPRPAPAPPLGSQPQAVVVVPPRAAVWPPQPSGAGLDAVRLAGAEGAHLILSFYTETGYKGVGRGEYANGTPFFKVHGCSVKGRRYINAALARWRAIFTPHLQLPEAGRSSVPWAESWSASAPSTRRWRRRWRTRGLSARRRRSLSGAWHIEEGIEEAVAAEGEGLRLHLSIHSATGYKGVREINKASSGGGPASSSSHPLPS